MRIFRGHHKLLKKYVKFKRAEKIQQLQTADPICVHQLDSRWNNRVSLVVLVVGKDAAVSHPIQI